MIPIFAAPWVLLALVALPVLWWLLRVTPPSPRRELFPAIRLLYDLTSRAETPAHTPLWLLALRMLAAALVIIGLARPVLDAGRGLEASGPVLLVIDDGWAAAAAWPIRMAAAEQTLARAERAGARVALLTTAPGFDNAAPAVLAAMPVADLRPRLAALRPKPWPVRRDPAVLAGVAPGSVVYIADGIGPSPEFARALAAIGPVEEIRDPQPPVLLTPPRAEADQLVVRVLTPAAPAPRSVAVLAQTGDGRTLARVALSVAAGADSAEAALRLPPELRNRLTRLAIEGSGSAGGVALLDERWRRRPVGLVAGEAVSAEAPLIGPLFYLNRALAPYAEIRQGDLRTLLARDLSVLILADLVVSDGVELDLLSDFVARGGMLIRFAGPNLAEHPDRLMPVKLLDEDRRLGGAMSWSQPPGLAAFDPKSPFAGLTVPAEVHVTRQILAAPTPFIEGQDPVWARLSDGTPLVTQAARGAGRIVLFHVTANADWSDLPLSGLFVDMMRRLVALSVGVSQADAAGTMLAPVEILDGFGVPGPPNPAASPLAAREVATALAAPQHPPGLYGPEAGRRVLNLGGGIARVEAAAPVPGAREVALTGEGQERNLAPLLMALAVVLLALDLLVSLRLRGLWLQPAALALLAVLSGGARADEPNPALVTRLGYVVTGDAAIDGISRAGLAGLSDYVNRRTNAELGPPAAVQPGTDDLSLYPLLYWPVPPDAEPQAAPWIVAMNGYMSHGGIVLIDTQGGGAMGGGGLIKASAGLSIPALAPLTSAHVLSRSFYLLSEYPGRHGPETVWVQRDQDRANDSVSPVIIGGADWAAAWAVDGQGRNPYATLPGGARQRVLAYRFGVNLVMYALTGNYKGDQVHIPAQLERLGQ